MIHPSDDLADYMYNNIDHQTMQQKETNHNSLYILADNELQSNFDLEDQNEAVDWNSTNSHKSELVIAYDNKVGNRPLRPKLFSALYIRPKDDGNSHLIYKLSTDQILVTKEYQSVPVPADLIEGISETGSSDTKVQVNHVDSDHSIVQDDHSNNNDDDGHIHSNNKDDSEDESYDELDGSQQLNNMESNKIVEQENHNLLTVESSNSTCVCVKQNGTTITSTFLQCLFVQYLHEVVITILCLQPFIPMSVHEDTLRHLYEATYTIIHLLSSLLTSLRSEIPQPSLLTSL